MTAFDDLLALMPPAGGARFDWGSVERELGFALPGDYKQLIDAYGRGLFRDDVGVWAPVPPERGIVVMGSHLRDEFGQILDTMTGDEEWRLPDGSIQPVTIERGDPPPVFGWGGASGGQYGYWHTSDPDPDKWPVVFTDLRGEWDYHPGGLVAYLYALLSGEWQSTVIDLPDQQPPSFTPIPHDGT
ncbi:hypothetical protein ACQP1G_16845 [Nocardia sp. CA-107356]|uniref:hypothetical protein n=1 Tax=Nocardia sp. CA-107356 TaxID=3239972 RepID=UPI003D8EE2C9